MVLAYRDPRAATSGTDQALRIARSLPEKPLIYNLAEKATFDKWIRWLEKNASFLHR